MPYEARANNPETATPAQRIRADWQALVETVSIKGIVKNIPFIAYLALLCVLFIYNSHHAVETQRQLDRELQVLKELRWRHMDINSKLMNAGMEREIIKRGAEIGLHPLTLPAYTLDTSTTQTPAKE